MNGSTITSSGAVTSGGVAITPDASWHIVEIGDFNGDSNSDILWRSDAGAVAEWLMNGNTIVQSLTPNLGRHGGQPRRELEHAGQARQCRLATGLGRGSQPSYPLQDDHRRR